MKRTSHRAIGPKQLIIIFCVSAVLALILLLRTFVAGFMGRAQAFVLAYNPLAPIAAQFLNRARLESENSRLQGDLASTTALVADRNMLYQENLALKARLGRDATTHTVLAGVILRPPGMPYDTLLIDAGSRQGIARGEYVSAGGETLIGKIDEVYATTARVVLFSAPGESHQALLLETAAHVAIPLVVEGQGGGSLMSEVPAHTNVQQGDIVAFPDVAGGLTAAVSLVDAKNGESFERVYLHAPVNPLQLQFVEVVLP